MEVLNLIVPPHVPHKELVRISHRANLSLFKFMPLSQEYDEASRPWCVKDIIEFLGTKLRIIVFENEDYDVCSVYFEILGDERHDTNQVFKFRMAEMES